MTKSSNDDNERSGQPSTRRRGPHVFCDTTEVVRDKTCASGLGRIGNQIFLDGVRAIGAELYVVDLVIEEVAQLRLRSFEETVAKLAPVRAYVDIGTLPSSDGLRRQFVDELTGELRRIGTIIVPVCVDLQAVLAFSKRHLFPLRRTTLEGFHDAVILLSSIQYAKQNGLSDCWFVSADKGFDGDDIRALGRQAGVGFRQIRGTDDAVRLFEQLKRVRITTLEADAAVMALAFMTTHLEAVREYLRRYPVVPPDLVAGELGLPVRIENPVVTGIERALPETTPVDGTEIGIEFEVNVTADLRLTIRPTIQDLGATMQAMHARGGSGFGDRIPIRIRGRARARFDSGHFVGEPTIEELRVESIEYDEFA